MRGTQQALLIVLAFVLTSVVRADDPEKYALLIGVTKYDHARMNRTPLEYPETDAGAVADLLTQSGYDVDLLSGEKATQEAVKTALKRCEKQGNADGVVVIGLFGHGVQYADDAYFAPWDTGVRAVTGADGNRVLNARGFAQYEPDPDTMVAMKEILNTLNACGAGNKVLLADCCREDPSAARGRAFGSSLRLTDLEPGTAAFFSCSASEQAFEHDDWGHGAFTRAFLDECNRRAITGKVRINDLAVPVHDRVLEMVNEKALSKQTVNPITNGIVDLQLVAPARIAGATRSDNGLKMEFRWCPPGEFTFRARQIHNLRSSRGTFVSPFEIPVHAENRVEHSSGFWLSTFETSVADFVSVLPRHRETALADLDDGQDPSNRSVTSTWLQATEFCRALTRREQAAGRLPISEAYVLPTVSQWQYAVHANVQTRFFWGDDFDEAASYLAPTTPFHAYKRGTRLPNPWGFHDLVGAAQEWCQDRLPDTAWPSGTDPVVANSDRRVLEVDGENHSFRILAGAVWYSTELEANGLLFDGGEEGSPYWGFRVARVKLRR